MKNTTESITPESILKSIPGIDIPGHRQSLREMMDGYFLWFNNEGMEAGPAFAAYRAVDGLLAEIHEYNQAQQPVYKNLQNSSN